jgi:hypothetical protein
MSGCLYVSTTWNLSFVFRRTVWGWQVCDLVKSRRLCYSSYFLFGQFRAVWPSSWHVSQTCFLLHHVLLHPRSELKLLHVIDLSFGSFLCVVGSAAGCVAFFCLREVQYVSRRICGISYAGLVVTLP